MYRYIHRHVYIMSLLKLKGFHCNLCHDEWPRAGYWNKCWSNPRSQCGSIRISSPRFVPSSGIGPPKITSEKDGAFDVKQWSNEAIWVWISVVVSTSHAVTNISSIWAFFPAAAPVEPSSLSAVESSRPSTILGKAARAKSGSARFGGWGLWFYGVSNVLSPWPKLGISPQNPWNRTRYFWICLIWSHFAMVRK